MVTCGWAVLRSGGFAIVGMMYRGAILHNRTQSNNRTTVKPHNCKNRKPYDRTQNPTRFHALKTRAEAKATNLTRKYRIFLHNT